MDQIFRDQTAKEEFDGWKASCNLLYDVVGVHMLPIPGQTVDWVGKEQSPLFKLVSGTEADTTEKGAIVPVEIKTDQKQVLFAEEEFSLFPGDIDRLRCNPRDRTLYAFNSADGSVYIQNEKKSVFKQVKALTSGSGLDWSQDGKIACGSQEGDVVIIDSESAECSQHYQAIRCVVRDLSWSCDCTYNQFGAACEDGQVVFFDCRQQHPSTILACHSEDCLVLRAHPSLSHLFLTGSASSVLALWDHRFPSHPLHMLEGHSGEITCAAWSPHTSSMLATGSDDMKVILWDLSKIGQEQSAEEEEDGAAELLFTHRGHTETINDLQWHPINAGVLASVADDGSMQVWKMSEALFKEDRLEDAALE